MPYIDKAGAEMVIQAAAKAIQDAVAEEREACARLLEASARDWPENEHVKAILFSAAAAIRARGGEGG